MQYVIVSMIAVATVALAIGAITGRVQARSCCAPADPARDRRMQMDEHDAEPSSLPPNSNDPRVGSTEPTATGTGRPMRPAPSSSSERAADWSRDTPGTSPG